MGCNQPLMVVVLGPTASGKTALGIALAQHYGVAPQRVSAAILVSTTLSIVTVSVVIAVVTEHLIQGAP